MENQRLILALASSRGGQGIAFRGGPLSVWSSDTLELYFRCTLSLKSSGLAPLLFLLWMWASCVVLGTIPRI